MRRAVLLVVLRCCWLQPTSAGWTVKRDRYTNSHRGSSPAWATRTCASRRTPAGSSFGTSSSSSTRTRPGVSAPHWLRSRRPPADRFGYVLDTHYHWDHTQGNSILADEGVIVVCSRDCASELAVKGKGEWDQMSKRTDRYSLAPYRMEPPSLVFEDFMAIDDGERRLELRRVGPAHTIGDAVASFPRRAFSSPATCA